MGPRRLSEPHLARTALQPKLNLRGLRNPPSQTVSDTVVPSFFGLSGLLPQSESRTVKSCSNAPGRLLGTCADRGLRRGNFSQSFQWRFRIVPGQHDEPPVTDTDLCGGPLHQNNWTSRIAPCLPLPRPRWDVVTPLRQRAQSLWTSICPMVD